MYDFEFTLEPRFRQHLIIRACGCLLVAAAMALFGLSKHGYGLVTAATVPLLGALIFAGVWLWRARFATRISQEGIEVRGYFGAKQIPWTEVRSIDTYSYDRINPMAVANGRSSKDRTSGGGTKKVACVRVVRTSGRKTELKAPLVTRANADPAFGEKVRTIKAVQESIRTGTGFTPQAVKQSS